MTNKKILPEFKLIAEPITDDAKRTPRFKWAGPEIGTRHQLGGIPKFLQESEFPTCPDCNKEMTFYGQLDSINDDYCIADCGMIYVFICFDCLETKSIIQSF
jgi:uncharacterized protein YwqG